MVMTHSERGEGKVGLFIMILLLAAAIYVLVKVVPPRVNAYEFKDYIETYARTESWTRTPEEIQKDLLAKAVELNLPVEKKQIVVQKEGAYVTIRATFDVPVDLKVHKMVLHYDFKQSAEHY